MADLKTIQNNLSAVTEKMIAAAMRAGRDPEEVKLVVVSKGQPVEVIQAAISAGVRIFGENYPEESVEKIRATIEAGVEWHMIGHLQSRKARLVSGNFQYMHSLDSLHLAEKLDRILAENERNLPVLLEFNVGIEASKGGWQASGPQSWSGLLPDIEQILKLPHLKVRGLMTMPPLTVSPEEARIYFKRLAELRDYFRGCFPDQTWNELSMGTSSDFEVAIEEGATFVRIGTSILGPRPYKG
ncbi:YggS family pyridoxal phosphate-dependent enzyme [bacterium]|nr:YggS family pyridoxal phosphate-dependent enzyme [bacterium]